MTWKIKQPRQWALKSNGRTAVAISIRSTADHDRVQFRFMDERRPRSMIARKFLQHFDKVTP